MKKYLSIILTIFLLGFGTANAQLNVLRGPQGGTNTGTALVSDIGNCLKVSAVNPVLLWNIGTCGSGGGSFTPVNPFTIFPNYAATSTSLGFFNGFFSTASSTISAPFWLPTLSNGGLGIFGGLVSSGATTTAGTGLTYTNNAFNVNTSQNISTLSNLGSNGLVRTTGGTGALSIASNGTDYTLITANSCSAGQHFSTVTAAGIFTCTADSGGGGAAAGSWATSTIAGWPGVLNNYSNNSTDVVEIGSTSGTSTAPYFFDPNTNSAQIGRTSTASTTINGKVVFPSLSLGFAGISPTGQLYTFATSTIKTSQLTNDANFLTSAVTSVTGTWPIISSGGNTPNITYAGFGTTSDSGIGNDLILYTSHTGIVKGVASSSLSLPNSALQNSTISGTALGGTLPTHSHDTSFTGTSYNGTAAVSDWGLALNHTNTWSVLQNFNYASITSYISSAVSSTTNFIINGQNFNNLLGTGLSNVGGSLTNSGVISLGNGTGTTCSGTNPGTCNVNTTQNITTLSNLATNGLVTTSGGNGTLGVTANGTGGFVLAMANGVPTWVATTTFSGGLTYSNGNVTNSGVTSIIAGSNISVSGSTGAVTINASSPFEIGTSSTLTLGQSVYVSQVGGKTILASVATGTVSASAPLSVTAGRSCLGGACAFSITQSGSGTDGYLSSIDWNTFNNKSSSGFPFTVLTGYNATDTPIAFRQGLFSTASSTFSNNLSLSSLSQGSLYTGTNGLVGTTATTSVICTGSASCSPFTVFGSTPITINATGGTGSASYQFGTSTDGYVLYPFGQMLAVGTSTSRAFPLVVASSTVPQFALGDGLIGDAQWTFRNAGQNLYLGTTTGQGLATSSLSAFTILNNGNVGIASSSPTSQLTINQLNTNLLSTALLIDGVQSGAGAEMALNRSSNTGTEEANIDFNTNNVEKWQLGMQNNNTNDFELWDGLDDPAFTIKDGTNAIGFGTTTPFGDFAINADFGDPPGLVFNVASSSATATTTLFAVASNGNVGVGTTSPGTLFGIQGVANFQVGTSSLLSPTGGLNLTGGCFSIAGVCLSSSAGGGVTSLIAGSGISISASTGAVTVSNTNEKFATSTDGYTIYPTGQMMSIGTTTARTSTLTLATSTVPQLQFGDGIAGDSLLTERFIGGNMYWSTTTAQGLATSSTPFMTILNNGGLGINDSTPDFNLESAGSSVNGYFGITKATDGDIFNILSNGTVNIATTTNTSGAQLSIATSTKPQLSLGSGIAGELQFTERVAGGNFYLSSTTAQGNATTSTPALEVDGAGGPAIAVATSTPTAQLSINAQNTTDYANIVMIGTSTAPTVTKTVLRIDNNGNIFAPATQIQSSAATNYWCYDVNSQLIRVSAICTTSALKFKERITPLQQGLDTVMAMEPVNYYLNELGRGDNPTPDMRQQQIGFVADYEATTTPLLMIHDGNGEIHGFNYEQYTAILTKAIQQLNNKVDSMKVGKTVKDKWPYILIAIQFILFAGYVIYNEKRK